ncbi:MAG TPA: hypothetical protein VFA53_05305 [Xanthobacteraceae bacterium]|nr:hypothetical protein [Xanthobacteraceae bacterium]
MKTAVPRLVLIAGALLLLSDAAGALPAPDAAPAPRKLPSLSKPTPQKPAAAPTAPKTPAVSLQKPMIFYLANGEPGACGIGCSEWIAAEGKIGSDTPDRLRAFLKRHPGTKRPVIFHSPGGLAWEALAIGRLMRERGLTAGIGQTMPESCRDKKPEACDALKRSGQELKGTLTNRASCASACVYAIVGARVREISPDSLLLIHHEKLNTSEIPKGVHLPSNFAALAHARFVQRVKGYLVEMGVKPALLDAAEKVPYESIRALTREEITQFGIDTRDFVETRWEPNDGSNYHAVLKTFYTSEKEKTKGLPRINLLQLRCLDADHVGVFFGRQFFGDEKGPEVLKIRLSDQEFALERRTSPVNKEPSQRFDVRLAWVPFGLLESVARSDGQIQILEPAGENSDPRSLRAIELSTQGLSTTISILAKSCANQQHSHSNGTSFARSVDQIDQPFETAASAR